MAIMLGNIALDEAYTAVQERFEEVGGRDARIVRLTGLIVGAHTLDDIEARLDAVLDAASQEDYAAALIIRPGRRLFVRRTEFTREVSRATLTGSFVLQLEARNPFEESVALRIEPWAIETSGASLHLSAAGNASAQPVITVTALEDLVHPALADGERAIVYEGLVPAGAELLFHAADRTVTLNGSDVTPYALGLFPRIAPEGSTLTYTDAPESAHRAAAVIAWRDRWW